jgi:hypothetical protein
MEMRTSIDAANVLNLNGIPFLGTPLNLMRTKKYDGGGGIEAYLKWDALYQMWVEGDLRLMTAGTPTRVLMVSNVTTPEALAASPALYLDIIEDVRLECSQTGMVRSVLVPRTASAGAGQAGRSSGGVNGPNSPVGKVFIEMETVDQAVNTLMLLKVRNIHVPFGYAALDSQICCTLLPMCLSLLEYIPWVTVLKRMLPCSAALFAKND